MLYLDNVSVGFDDAQSALAEADLRIAEGQRLLVCGAAGSGKSTLINVAAGLIPRLVTPPHFAGTVFVNGRDIGEFTKDELFATVGIVSQNVEEQLWDLHVEDTIAFPLENRGVEKQVIRDRLAELLDSLELRALSGRRVLTLSGGERRMVAIAAALASRPSLLVLDEPTTGLDPAARGRLVRILNELADEIPALLVSDQDPASLLETIDSVALLTDGRLTPAAPADSLVREEAPWRTAGVLPPHRRREARKPVTPGETLLSVSGLRTRLARPDGRPVLEDVGFEVRTGETVALIGRNGAGKTTLFQSVLGLSRITAGDIAIGGRKTDGWTAAQRARSIAYLPQNMRRILFNMTVLEEVVFAITASTGRKDDPEAAAKATATLEKYDLGPLAEKNPFALSARQQALLGLACAEAAETPLAILDEPLLARDIRGRDLLMLFLDTMRSSGRAAMLISHDLELIDDVASRTLILDAGKIVFDGDPDAGWTSPAFRTLGWPAPYSLLGEAA